MMRKYVLFVLFTLFSVSLNAQTGNMLSATEAKEVMQSLTQAASQIKTLQCAFVQQKSSALLAENAVAKGKMLFRSPDRLRWQYTEPFAYTLLVRGDSVTVQSAGQTQGETAANSRLQKAVSGMVTGMVSGRRLFDENAYEIQLFDHGTLWKAEMRPKSRNMKRMFNRLTLSFDKQTRLLSELVIEETGGDWTSIRFKEVRTNLPVSENMFIR